jgi:hypothetical protein
MLTNRGDERTLIRSGGFTLNGRFGHCLGALALCLTACEHASKGPAAVATVEVQLPASTLAFGAAPLQASAVLRDASGNVLTGRDVAWASGDPAIATVDSAGLIQAVAPGPVSIRATSEGKSGSATLTVAPGAPSAISAVAGGGQTAAPGSAVAVPPEVLVVDAGGHPVPGATVTFAAASGGGSVATAQATAGADGHASCGGWTLGATLGTQTLTASIGNASVFFTADALRSSGDVTAVVLAPVAGRFIETKFTSAVSVRSTYQLASVTASIGSTSVPLVYGRFGPAETAWSGTLSAAGIASGPQTVLFTATDVLGNVTDTAVHVQLDPLPVISIAAPSAGALARPTTAVSVTCSDDAPAGCASLTVQVGVGGAVLLSGTTSLSGSVDLSTYEGSAVDLVFTAADTTGRNTLATRKVYVDSSSLLTLVETVPGVVWDHDATRTLYVDQTDTTPVLRIRDSGQVSVQDVEANAALMGVDGGYGFLTPSGAIYVRSELNSPYCSAHEWRGGSRLELGGLNSCPSLRVAGSYAIFSKQDALSEPISLIRRDLTAGTNTVVSTDAGNVRNDVAATGDVAFWTAEYRIVRWHDGSATTLPTDDPNLPWSIYPVTDGTTVVYEKTRGTSGPMAVALNSGAGEVFLASGQAFEPAYAIASGWIAFTREDAAREPQIWRRSAGGALEQLTFFGTSSMLEAIFGDGTVVLTHGARRYRAIPGRTLEDVGTTQGKVIERAGRFYVLLGGNVLRVEP